jgi:hypothetical protein
MIKSAAKLVRGLLRLVMQQDLVLSLFFVSLQACVLHRVAPAERSSGPEADHAALHLAVTYVRVFDRCR